VADRIDILLELKRVAEFVSGAQSASKAVGGIGGATEKAGKQAGLSWKGVAKWAGAASIVYGAQRFLRGAVSTTEELGKTTLALHHVTGMDVQTSSQWAAMMKARGLNARSASMAFIKVSQSMESARQGSAKASTELRNLGIQMDIARQKGGKTLPADLKKLGDQMTRVRAAGAKTTSTLVGLGVPMADIRRGNTSAVVMDIADAFQKMRNPAERAALTQKLFGRTGRELLPVLIKGSKGIRDQLGLASKYGAMLGVKNVADVKKLIASQRELKFAQMGVQVQLGTALMPVIIAVMGVVVKLARALSPLTKNATALKITLGLLTLAFVAYKVAMIAATIAETFFNGALLVTFGWIGLVIVALAAIGVAAYLVVKHWGAIKAAAMAAWGWIKANWPLLVGILLGPFGIAVAAIATHWKTIKAGAAAAVQWIKNEFNSLVAWFQGLPGRIGDWLSKVPGVGLATKIASGGASVASKLNPFKHFQHGGSLSSRALALVGERGPEVVSLPASATVAPLSRGQTLAAAGAGAGQTIVTKVYLDRRQIAEAVGTYAADRIARR
jgi:hypothetical protein